MTAPMKKRSSLLCLVLISIGEKSSLPTHRKGKPSHPEDLQRLHRFNPGIRITNFGIVHNHKCHIRILSLLFLFLSS